MRVGVRGLGRMGGPIRARLAAVFEVVAVDPVVEPGGSVAGADVLVTVLHAPDASALEGLERGSLWLDLSSTDPTVASELADVATARGIVAVAAPMGGGPAEAAAGTLRFTLGGTADPRADAVLAELGTIAEPRLETPAQAHLVKLLGNSLWFGQVIAVTEALLLAERSGIDPEVARALLAAGPGGSVFLERHAPRLLAGDDMTDFGLDRVVAELATVRSLAASAGTPHELLELVTRLHEEALAEFGAVDGELLAARLLQLRAL